MTPATRFIPYASSDIASMCLKHTSLKDGEVALLRRLFDLLSRQFGLETLNNLKQIKRAYSNFDPDSDLRESGIELPSNNDKSFELLLAELLNKANFDRVSQEAIENSLGDSSIFKVHLKVDFSNYEQVLLFKRGVDTKTEIVRTFLGLRKRKVEFVNFDRVLVYIRLRNQQQSKIMLRLFQNVPRADLEMLFPETKVGLRFVDKLLFGIPALVSGVLVLTTKLGASLILIGSLAAFYLGMRNEPVILDQTGLLAIAAGFAALGGYLWKQFSSFKNRKLKFSQALTSNLYFKLLDNNAGVFYRIADSAMEEELKEALLAYFFLWKRGVAVRAKDLDDEIQRWFRIQWQCVLDFEVNDALSKLRRLDLATQDNSGAWKVIALQDAVAAMEAQLKAF